MTEPDPSTGAPSGKTPWARRTFTLDLRSLALFRVAIGLCTLFDVASRLPDVDAFYTDRGILPRGAFLGGLANPWAWSLHLVSGQWAVQLLLFALAIVLALGVVLGYRTRLCTIASWVLLASMQARNPMINHGGDLLLRLMLFWGIFLPLGGRLSLDRSLNPESPRLDRPQLSAGTAAFVIQVCAVYAFAAIEKLDPVWYREGSALHYALGLDQFATGFGRFLRGLPDLLRVATWSTLVLEVLGPIVLLTTAWTSRLRLVAVLAFVAFHTGAGLSLALGTFSWVACAMWTAFVPPFVWDALARRARARSSGLVLFFDGACGFCRRAVDGIRELLLLPAMQLREAQSDAAAHATMRENESWVVRDANGGTHVGYDGFVELCRRSVIASWLVPALSSSPARRIGEDAYRAVASDRNRASAVLERLLPPPPRQIGQVASAIAVAAIALVLADLLNLRVPEPVTRAITLARLGQRWNLFAPHPTRDDGWFVIEGELLDGRRVDLWNGGAPSWEKPRDVVATYRDARWQKYLTNVRYPPDAGHRPHFGRYLCREWNERHAGIEQVDVVRITYVLEETPPPGEPASAPRHEPVWEQRCLEASEAGPGERPGDAAPEVPAPTVDRPAAGG